jgi:GWxTD domain-containing protein
MMLIFFLTAALNFYVDPVIYRAAMETYQKQLADLTAKVAAEEKTLDSLRAAGRNPTKAAEVENQLKADQDLLNVHSQLQSMMAQDGYYYIEFECEIPYQELTYREINKKIIADFDIIFKFINRSRSDSLTDTLYYQYSISSFSEAVKAEPSFLEQFGMFIPAGSSDYALEVVSGENRDKRTGTVEVKKEDYTLMSDLLVASNITNDTAGGYFNKGALKVIPRPAKVFNDRYANLYTYYELYDLTPDSSPVNATYELVNAEGKLIRRASQRLAKIARSQSVNFGISTLGVSPGVYAFRVAVSDSIPGRFAQRSVPVSVERKVQKEMTYEGLPYYDEIEYFLTPDEYRRFTGFAPEAKSTYLKKFWKQMNYSVVAQRFEYADSNFRQGNKPGRKTDRGRIYVKFGPPDEIQKTPIELQESRPYEQWVYYNGAQFIFVDIRGTTEYTLVWTNARGEKSQPSLYTYLPKSIQDQINSEKAPVFDQ